MKIALIIENISLKAGTERAVINEANLLEEANNKVCLISIYSKKGDNPGFHINKNINIIHLGYHFSWGNKKLITYAQLYFKLPQIVNKIKADIAIGSSYIINYILAFGHFKAKTVGCEHFNYDNLPDKKKKFRKIAYAKLDAVVVLTHHDAAKYNFIKEERLFVIPNSISNVPLSCCDMNSHTIISVGRLTYQKGYDLLLQVANQVKPILPNWNFAIWGSGEDENALREQCHELGLDGFVHFNGRTDEVNSKLLNSSIYVMTSRFEGLPMALIEVQSCGLPIVAFDCPEGPSEIIHNEEDGFLIKFGDIDTMASKIVLLAHNDDIRKSMSNLSKRNSKKYEKEKVSELWQKMLYKIAEP